MVGLKIRRKLMKSFTLEYVFVREREKELCKVNMHSKK